MALTRRVRQVVRSSSAQAGFTTAEYAVGTVAACGFGGLLYKVLTSDSILELIGDVIRKGFEFLF
jgi:hypothetical protein